jgi:N-methylhydantoinase A/oxoprolinase/acetone carboxylase beta subunit
MPQRQSGSRDLDREELMSLKLGIDTGGTYTDAVLFDDEGGVIGSGKALTTKDDLSAGIREAIETVLPPVLADIKLVSISTTFATNAIVEGQGRSVCLLLIGYDPDLLGELASGKIVPRERMVFVRGGHDGTGVEMDPFDVGAAREAILAQAPHVDAFAVSGYFGVRNPAHELTARRLVRELTGKPVTCGHELTTRLNAPRRALTTALNARLIPLLEELVVTVRETLVARGIEAPLMVVKGDGSLVDAEMAIERPVETILSGPAASVVGASYGADVEEAFVIDMGGTTTDVITMRAGRLALNPRGARIGDLQIMVEAIDADTVGLGGDSEIRLDEAGNLCAGPRRVIPLSLLAHQHPEVLSKLQHQVDRHLDHGEDSRRSDPGYFITRGRQLIDGGGGLTPTEGEVWEALEGGPLLLAELLDNVEHPALYRECVKQLIEVGLVVGGAFTPTDAVHALGRFDRWSAEAARLGANLWAGSLGISPEQFCEKVLQQVEIQMGRVVIASALAEETGSSPMAQERVGRLLIDRGLVPDGERIFSVAFDMRRPLLAIGAPVGSYLPGVAKRLNARLVIPDHAEVRSALGAVVGGIVQSVRVLIQPLVAGSAYRVHLPSEMRQFGELEAAVECAENVAREKAEELAARAGARETKVHVAREDQVLRDKRGLADEIYLGTEVTATAVGRPRIRA